VTVGLWFSSELLEVVHVNRTLDWVYIVTLIFVLLQYVVCQEEVVKQHGGQLEIGQRR
jgi:hypothetical protein